MNKPETATPRALSAKLISRFAKLERFSPFYGLDGSWFAIGILDYQFQVLYRLGYRSVDEMGDQSRALIREIASYLGVIAARFWDEFGGFITLEISPRHGVLLKVMGGDLLPDSGSHEVRIEKNLLELLLDPPSELEIVPGFVRPLVLGDNILKLYATDLFFGARCFGIGDWRGEGANLLSPFYVNAERVLADGASRFYARLFSKENYGQVAELYLNKIIWPPLNADEEIPGLGGALGFKQFFEDYSVPDANQLEVLRNLIVMGDEVTSTSAMLYLTARYTVMPGVEDMRLFQAHYRLNRILREALKAVRAELGWACDWLEENHDPERHDLCYEIERSFGFLHWIKFSMQRVAVRDQEFSAMFAQLASGDLESGGWSLQQMINENPADIELRIQKAYLQLYARKYEECEKECRMILSEPGADQEARLYFLLGSCAFSRSEQEEALDYLRSSAALPARDGYAAAELEYSYASALLASGQIEEAREQFRKNIKGPLKYFSFNNEMELLSLYRMTNSFDDLEELLVRLVKIHPWHPAVMDAVQAF